MNKPLLITSGEPAGIGPELCALLAEGNAPSALGGPVVVVGDWTLLNNRAQSAGISPQWSLIGDSPVPSVPEFFVKHVPLSTPCQMGVPSPENGHYVLALLDLAVDWCSTGQARAMTTAPIQKSAISPIWPGFQGHTEYLAERCNTPQVVMMLAGGGLRVALATTHLPLIEVPAAIQIPTLTNTLRILLADLKNRWGIASPRVLVTGLNPHAGESGTMGREEIEVISPVIRQFQAWGEQVEGPYPADTLFQPKLLTGADAVLAMYHDQGLPVLKYASFGEGVNITLGLPIVRTSVDHGTALDLVGTRRMNVGSLMEALHTAHDMSKDSTIT